MAPVHMDLPAPDAASEPVTGRRRLLLDAAVTVVAGGGLRALTHRAVDAAAGVPQGSTSTYYRTRIALLSALTAHVSWLLGERIAECARRIAVIEDVDEQARAARIVDEVVLLFVMHVSEPDLVVVQAELGVESVRTPELMTVLGQWRLHLVAIVTEIGSALSRAHAADRAEITVAAFQGVLLSALPRPQAERAAYVERATRQLIEVLRS
jgi:DNA-binding transcriptional regulator YbjK